MITPHHPWRSGPRITRAAFAAFLKDQHSPAYAERDAGEYWDYCVKRGIDPCYIAAVFNHESRCGNDGVARTTKSWGNTRIDPHFGPDPIKDANGKFVTADGAQGVFPVYATWMDGLVSTVERFLSPEWVYYNRLSIKLIYDWPPNQELVWAPAGDANDPAAYLRNVIDTMNAITTERGKGDQADGWTVPEIVVRFLPENAPNNPGYVMDPQEVTIHETDNTDLSADAEAHARYLLEGATNPDNLASWHGTVDNAKFIQHLDFLRSSYNAGDKNGPGNRTSIALERCVNHPVGSQADESSIWNQAYITAQLNIIYPHTASHDVQHNFWARVGYTPEHKDCPLRLRAAGRWQEFLDLVQHIIIQQMSGTNAAVPDPPQLLTDPVTGERIWGGILQRYRFIPTDVIELYGRPLDEEHQDPEILGPDGQPFDVIQNFERARFEWKQGQWPDRWDVTLGRLGAENLELRAQLKAYRDKYGPL